MSGVARFRKDWIDEAGAWDRIKRVIDSSFVVDIEEVVVAARAAGVRVRIPGELPSSDMDFHREDLQQFLEGKKPPRRPDKYRWADCEAAMANGMIPPDASELGRWMMDWFIDQDDDHPSARQIRRRAAPMCARLRGHNP